MSKYRLAAFDMDGTLLDSNKNIRKDSLIAMRKAYELGRYLCMSTGRNLQELKSYRKELTMMEYIICISGALIVNNFTDEIIYEKALPIEDVIRIFEIGKDFDNVIHLHGIKSHLQKNHVQKLSDCGMGVYVPMFNKVSSFHEDIFEEYKAKPYNVYKFNFYCRNSKQRLELEKALSHLPVTICYAETKSLEISPLGVSKASGLNILCDRLGIALSETIAVGDADNDLAILRTAGLGIAMGNANENVKAASDVLVSDCDNGGIAEAIEKYLIGIE